MTAGDRARAGGPAPDPEVPPFLVARAVPGTGLIVFPRPGAIPATWAGPRPGPGYDPDWILATGGRVPPLQRHQLVLDLTRPEVTGYLLDTRAQPAPALPNQ